MALKGLAIRLLCKQIHDCLNADNVEPAVDKDRNEIRQEDYVIRQVDLSPASTGQLIVDFEESSLAMKEKMLKTKAKCKRLREENIDLYEYIKNFKRPPGEASPSFIPPPSLPKEVVDDVEVIRVMAQNSKEWIEDVYIEARKFIKDLAQHHSKFVAFLNRLETTEGLWEDVHIYQDLTIPRLRALTKIPRQILIDGKVIQENEVYDFPRWFCVVCSGKNTFDKFSMESLTLKDSIRKV